MDRKSTFILALVYLTVILVVGLLFFLRRDLLFFVPNTGMFGPIPVGVPWFGALGAVLISLTGVFEHEHDWDMSYWPWHVARPLVGAAVAVVSVLIIQSGSLGAGFTPVPNPTPTPTPVATQPAPTVPPASVPTRTPGSTQPEGSSTTTPPSTQPASNSTTAPASNTGAPATSDSGKQDQNKNKDNPPLIPKYLFVYVIAFSVGYREETFRELIKRLVDVILSPGNGGAAGAPTISGANPNQAPHGTPTQVTITGSGLGSTQSVKFGSTAAQQFKANPDGTLTVTTPIMAAAGQVVLSVTTKGGAASTNFTFS